MANCDLQAEVIQFVADERGLSVDKVRLRSRLLEDLGMDGDDAVDFFKRLEERYKTDLGQLYEQWDRHFGPEGFSCLNGLVIVPAAVVGGLVAGLGNLSIIWGLAVTVALLAAWAWAMRRRNPSEPTIPITVVDVLSAVEAGAWPRPPQD